MIMRLSTENGVLWVLLAPDGTKRSLVGPYILVLCTSTNMLIVSLSFAYPVMVVQLVKYLDRVKTATATATATSGRGRKRERERERESDIVVVITVGKLHRFRVSVQISHRRSSICWRGNNSIIQVVINVFS